MDQERLQKIIDAYFDAKEKIFELEGEFAAVAISSTKWRENLRHAFDHLMTGLKFGGDPAKKEEEEMHLTEALSHVKNLPLDGYEHLAGSFLTRSRLKIEKAGLLGTIGEARELHKKAISNYNKGRELRTGDPEECYKHFKKCIKLADEASIKAQPLSRKDKIGFWFIGIGILLTLINILLIFYKG